jgi:hypothetical protein
VTSVVTPPPGRSGDATLDLGPLDRIGQVGAYLLGPEDQRTLADAGGEPRGQQGRQGAAHHGVQAQGTGIRWHHGRVAGRRGLPPFGEQLRFQPLVHIVGLVVRRVLTQPPARRAEHVAVEHAADVVRLEQPGTTGQAQPGQQRRAPGILHQLRAGVRVVGAVHRHDPRHRSPSIRHRAAGSILLSYNPDRTHGLDSGIGMKLDERPDLAGSAGAPRHRRPIPCPRASQRALRSRTIRVNARTILSCRA